LAALGVGRHARDGGAEPEALADAHRSLHVALGHRRDGTTTPGARAVGDGAQRDRRALGGIARRRQIRHDAAMSRTTAPPTPPASPGCVAGSAPTGPWRRLAVACAVASTLGALGLASQAHAAGFYIPERGARTLAMGGAFVAG